MAKTITYRTGRTYNDAQILSITFEPADDDMADVSVTFIDASRNIAGRVRVFGFDANPLDIGRAVLREYDAGRYDLT